MKKYRVGILGATGMVGQRFVSLLNGHPWFEIKVLAASGRSAGKTYAEALVDRWAMTTPLPEEFSKIIVLDATGDFDKIVPQVDFVFSAVDMPKDEILALEERYAKAEIPVMSNNSPYRSFSDVPMLIPEINPEHAEVVEYQRKRLGSKKGFIAVKSNCSIQSYVPALHPLMEYGITDILACTYQAISGAGKTFETWPEMIDNVIPFIGGEEEKSEKEPLKIWGRVVDGNIVNESTIDITSQCIRVPVTDGHLAAVFVRFKNKPSRDEIISAWNKFSNPEVEKLGLPTAPKQFLRYFEEDNRPQTKLDRDIEKGMTISVGRLREDSQFDYKFVCLSHNTLRGAAGGGVLMAEFFAAKGYFD